MSDLNKFVGWLSYDPSYSEIAEALVVEYLQDLQVTRIRFGKTNLDDSAVVLGQYGYHDSVPIDQAIPGHIWRSLDSPEIHIITGVKRSSWSDNGLLCVVELHDKGLMQGHAVFEFDYEIGAENRLYVLSRVTDYCNLISLFISFHSGRPHLSSSHSADTDSLIYSRVGALNPRQIDVLRGLIEGKSNLQIARHLGYSLSTIKQETMRIFEALSVSNRHDAAQKAVHLSLV